ncbi:MAG: hypothetical protein HOP12_03385 [Candidatus Eisenbacteria bacterium]|uniref:FlgD/Vpr Ig-like domain-containing protein n=1 Tax=Eiseniibacteriota bacterium TaxID=2212470 RepID=A0A849SI05_UNCEI|nr:hypothetical protein [Candidatus Eisenbacteria bacterium]
MSRMSAWFRLTVLASALAALLTPGVCLAAWPNDPASPLTIYSAASQRFTTASIADGAGGYYLVWSDERSGNSDVYAQRIDANGTLLWNANGLPIATGSPSQFNGTLVADGTGGVIVAWAQNVAGVDAIFAQRLNSAGTALWTAGGVRVATQPNSQSTRFGLVPDGTGGAMFAWTYNFSIGDTDAYAQRLNASGVLQWGASGLAVASNTSIQDQVVAATDGVGGMWILWRDLTVANDNLYKQRLNSAGVAQFAAGGDVAELFAAGLIQQLNAIPDGVGGVIAVWTQVQGASSEINSTHVYPSGGFVIRNLSGAAPDEQNSAIVVSDGAGGAFVFWYDLRTDVQGDVYGSHLLLNGMIDPQWPSSGLAIVATFAFYQIPATATPDGQGGAIVLWHEFSGGAGATVKAMRLKANGTRPSGWNATGNMVCAKPGAVNSAVVAPTGQSGMFASWFDVTNSPTYTISAQRIDQFGQIGQSEPRIVNARDVPNDQGGQVRVSWNASPLENSVDPLVRGYQVWRQVPPNIALAAKRAGRASLLREIGTGVNATYWEYAGGVAAQHFAGYSMTVDTESDSIAGSNPRTQLLVEAVDYFNAPGPMVPDVYWFSNQDSAYSVDNLPPTIPSGFAGTWSSGGSTLLWNANGEADLANYRLYRGASPSFVPSIANRIASPTQSWYIDAGASPFWYRVSAVDIHGNESGTALVLPAGTTAVGDDLPREVAFAITSGNPSRAGIAMRVELPSAARVDAAIYDASGRLVRELARETMAAGRWPLTWRGDASDGSRVGAGVYFVRTIVGDRAFSKRVVLMP